jgi:hypothetical protein
VAVALVVVDTEVTRLTAAVAGTWNGARDGARPHLNRLNDELLLRADNPTISRMAVEAIVHVWEHQGGCGYETEKKFQRAKRGARCTLVEWTISRAWFVFNRGAFEKHSVKCRNRSCHANPGSHR